ncbi:MAG: hypothetical protein AB8G16_11790 [Gammaproteobacteria bacterium]
MNVKTSKCLMILSAALALSACGTVTTIVPDAQGVEHISTLAMGCKKPHMLTQDCSGFSGAKRLVEVADFQFKIAGSADGTTVFMMGAKPTRDAWSGKSTEVANVAYEVVKKLLVDQGIKVTSVEPVSSGSVLAGYVITADADAYSVLSAYTVVK